MGGRTAEGYRPKGCERTTSRRTAGPSTRCFTFPKHFPPTVHWTGPCLWDATDSNLAGHLSACHMTTPDTGHSQSKTNSIGKTEP